MKTELTLRQRADDNILITGLEVMVVSTEDTHLEHYIGKYGVITSWNIKKKGLGLKLNLKLKFNEDNNDVHYFWEDDVKEVIK